MPAPANPATDAENELNHQLKLLYEEISDRVERVRHRLDQGEPPADVIHDVAYLLMAACMTNPTASPLHALADEAAAVLVYAAQLPEAGADPSPADH